MMNAECQMNFSVGPTLVTVLFLGEYQCSS